MKIGRRIYYDKSTGNVIQDTGERYGDVIETTQEQDFASFATLAQRVPSSVGVIQLVYGQLTDHFGTYPYHVDPTTGTIVWGPSVNETLDGAKAAKIQQLKIAESDALKTFKSSALGTPHTYLSGMDDMILLNGEYAFVKGNDYDGKPIIWYTIEAGNVSHTAAQFVQVYLDARKNVQTVKYRRATKEGQVNACTATSQVDTIGWPINPTPPSVPTGLAGTAGTGQAALTWAANSDVTMLGGGGYNVYVDGAANPVNTLPITAGTAYTVMGLAVGVHTFQITAVDTDGNESAKCAAVSVTVT